MKTKELVYLLAFIVVISVAVGSTLLHESFQSASSTESSSQTPPLLVQLTEEGRENAATMGLLNVPPMQPVTHVGRWNPELHHESCLACHGKAGTGAPTPPADHFYDNDPKGTVFRDNCVQCHAQQNDTKTAFNN